MKRSKAFGIGLVALGGIATVAIAATPADYIVSRQSAYKKIGAANKAIGDQLKGGSPDIAVIRTNAQVIDSLAPKVYSWFPKGSGPETGIKTAAKPEIWTDNATFKKDSADFAAAAKQLNVAATSGDMAKVTAAAQAVGGTCKGCHDQFRQRNN